MTTIEIWLTVAVVVLAAHCIADFVASIGAWRWVGGEIGKVSDRLDKAVSVSGQRNAKSLARFVELEGAINDRGEQLGQLAEIVCGVGDAGGHFRGGLDERVAENAKALAELAKGPPSDGALKACVEELEKRLEDRRACTCRAFEQVDRRIDDLEAKYAIDLTLGRIREGLAHAIGVELPAVAETQPTEKLFVRRELIITNDERSNRAVSDAIVGLIGKPGVCFEKVEEQIRPVVDPDAETETNIQSPASIFPDATGDSIADDGFVSVPLEIVGRYNLVPIEGADLPEPAFSPADDNAHASNDGLEPPLYGNLPCGHPAGCWGTGNDGKERCLWCGDLHDLRVIAKGASKVYEHITHGAVGKPMTDPDVVIALSDDAITKQIEEAVAESGEVEPPAPMQRFATEAPE